MFTRRSRYKDIRPHPHWTRRSKLGHANPIVAIVLYTLHAKQQAMQHHAHMEPDPLRSVPCFPLIPCDSTLSRTSAKFVFVQVAVLGAKNMLYTDTKPKGQEQFVSFLTSGSGNRLVPPACQHSQQCSHRLRGPAAPSERLRVHP